MSLKIYNTLSRKKEKFVPLKKGKVGVYSCGPTVYNYAHIGNLRTYLFNDFLVRSLRFFDFEVEHVMNITDVDDKTIRESLKVGESLKEFTRKFERIFLGDIEKLNIVKPKILRATESISEMVEMIQELLEKGFAYKADDGIYFSVEKFKDYGVLAGLDKVKIVKERISGDEYDKENVKDFALWKFYSESDGNNFWKASFGKGRPGWHIECSAMSRKALGTQFDIHTGAQDLIFPHHTNEIAQSEAATGKRPFVKYWMHAGFLNMKEDKMSKSLGNILTLKGIVEKGFSPLDFRYLCLTTHYKKPLLFSFENLESAKNAYQRLKNIIKELSNSEDKVNKKNIEGARKEFSSFVEDDLNMPRALSYLWEILRDESTRLNASEKYVLALEFDKIFGLRLDAISDEKISVPSDVKKLIDAREKARVEKNWKEADKLRDEIQKKGFQLNDTKDGVRVERV